MAISQDSATTNRPSKPKGTQLELAENSDFLQIRNRLQGGTDAAEVASEGHRVCRINAFFRRDLQQARDEIRKNRIDRQRQAVQEDALRELRDELPATCRMLERLWVLLEQRKVKIPDDVKADYQALKVKGSQGKKIENPKTKTERKAERLRVDRLHKGPEEGKAKQTTFLLHTPDGEMYDARKSILITDEAGEEDVPDEQMTAEDAAAIEHADFMKNGSSYQPRALTLPSGLTAKNVVAGVKRRSNTSNPFATLKKPKRVVDSLVDIYQSYQKIALQAAEVNEYLRTLRADSITNAALIGVLKNVQPVAKQYLAARKVHDIAFKAALRIPAHSDPLVLEEFVATDAKAYMTMTTEWSSKTFMAMKSAPNMSVAMGKVLEDQIQGVKKSNPGLAERMSK